MNEGLGNIKDANHTVAGSAGLVPLDEIWVKDALESIRDNGNKGLGNSLKKGDASKTLASIVASKQPVNYNEAVINNEILEQLAKDVAYNKLVDSDKPLKDATAQMLVMAQGPKAFSYLVPELTTVGRVANTISTKNVNRLHGLPTKQDIAESLTNATVRDKQLWRATGNGIKLDGWVNHSNNGMR